MDSKRVMRRTGIVDPATFVQQLPGHHQDAGVALAHQANPAYQFASRALIVALFCAVAFGSARQWMLGDVPPATIETLHVPAAVKLAYLEAQLVTLEKKPDVVASRLSELTAGQATHLIGDALMRGVLHGLALATQRETALRAEALREREQLIASRHRAAQDLQAGIAGSLLVGTAGAASLGLWAFRRARIRLVVQVMKGLKREPGGAREEAAF